MNILIVGLSHKTAPVETREKMSIPAAKMATAIAHLCSYPHIQEAAILSTCNRLEIYTVVKETKLAVQEVINFLCQHSQLPYQQLHRHLFILMQQEASTHLMQVASGLDSLVLGEGQILAQVKHSYKLAQQYGGSKIILNQLFQRAITTAKRVRTETKIGMGAVSVSSVAVELAQTKVENLAECRVAVIGAGKMARRLVQHLLAKRVSQIAIVNRSLERAKELSTQFGEAHLRCYPLEAMSSVVTASDLVFTSTAATEPLLNHATLTATLADNQPLMLFDISVPRNVSVDAENLPSVQVFNVDDLQSIVAQNQENRRQMVQKAQLIIEKELDAFCLWLRSRETVPVIKCLREKAEVIRQRELEKTMPRLSAEFTQKHQKAVEALTRAIVNKILHEPLIHLQSQPDLEAQRLAVEMLQMLFNLESCVISRVQQPTP